MNCTWTREQSVDPCVSLLSARGTVFFDARSLYCSMLANTFVCAQLMAFFFLIMKIHQAYVTHSHMVSEYSIRVSVSVLMHLQSLL